MTSIPSIATIPEALDAANRHVGDRLAYAEGRRRVNWSDVHRLADTLAAATGSPVVHFCYPNTGGQHRYYSAAVASVLRRLGFRSGTISGSAAISPRSDPYCIPRLGVSPRLAPVVELAAAVERRRLAA